MKTVKLTTAAALFLLLVGVAPYRGLERNLRQQSVAFFMPAGIAAAGGGADSLAGAALSARETAEALPGGAGLLNRRCSACHSVNFILKSGLLAGEVDSTLTCMQKKTRSLLDPREHDQLRLYLENRLPRE